jgi:ADP-heptose:LPS heptosyltransferase
MNKIAVFLHHGLGDVVTALPALWAVDRIQGGNVAMEIVVKSELEANIIESINWQGQVRLKFIPNASKLMRALLTAKTIWDLRRGRPDALVTPHLSDPVTASRIARFVGARVSVLPGKLAPELGEHKAVYYARFFRWAGIDLDINHLEFPPLEPRESGHRRLLLAPAVGAALEQHKKWPSESFAELASRVLHDWPDLQIELVGAPPESRILDDVYARLPRAARMRTHIRTENGVRDAAQAMVGADAIVTACSGASHLAAWAGIPVVGLYGPTNPAFTGPFTKWLYPVRKGYACSPCYRPGFISGCGSPVCMDHISVKDVLEAVHAALNGAPPPLLPVIQTSRAVAPNLDVETVYTQGNVT